MWLVILLVFIDFHFANHFLTGSFFQKIENFSFLMRKNHFSSRSFYVAYIIVPLLV